MIHSFRGKLLLTVVGLVALALVAIAGVTWHGIDASIADKVVLLVRLMVAGLLVLLVAAGVALWAGKRLIQPVDRLTDAAARVARGDYSQPIAAKNGTDFGALASALNDMQRAIEEREKRITYQAQHDLLTGAPNRNFISEWLRRRLEDDGNASPFCLAILHIAKLHELVDVYGSEVGDKLIQLVATRVQGVLKSSDIIARLDGSDFLLFFDGTSGDNIDRFGRRVLDLLAEPFRVGSIEIKTGARLGFAVFPEHGQDYDGLIRRAYIALSRAQEQRSDLAVYRIGQDEVHLRQIRITNRLQQAIRHNGFQLLYQPQYDLAKNRFTQVEAVVRWEDDELGVVPPDEFIPLAEHSGDITGISEWVVYGVLKQLAQWQAANLDLAVSINLSARDILRRQFVQHLIDAVNHADVQKNRLIVEVTESAVVEDPNHAIANLHKLRDAGLRVAMDDFGTGYSSLSQLKALPIHELKIDKSFILELDKDESDQKIVRSTIEMAHSLGLRVIAEGVESISTLQLLEQCGCDMVQGYCLSRPLRGDELARWLEESEEKVAAPTS